jgi:nucleotide-binding universal stress UspA family protein
MVALKKILVPVDFGDPSLHALDTAIALAKAFDGSITLVHVWEVPAYGYSSLQLVPVDLFTPAEEAARRQLDTLVARTRESLPTAAGILKCGVPWREILSAIEEVRPDIVIMGTHGRHGVGRAVLGSVAEKVVRTSPVAVLTVHAKVARAA